MRASFSVIHITPIVSLDRLPKINGLLTTVLSLCGHSLSEKNAIL